MGTRCQIRFEDEDSIAQIYKHGDGYPQGESGIIMLLVQLQKYLLDTQTFRDASYTAAQFIFVNKVIRAIQSGKLNTIKDLLEPMKKLDKDVPYFLLEHGVEDTSADIHGDEAFLYVVELIDSQNWDVAISSSFPEEDAFAHAKWQFDGSLEEAYKKFVEEYEE